MHRYLLLLVFILPTVIAPMKINKKEIMQNPSNEFLLNKALEIIHVRNQNYKLFNRSSERELRNLAFLSSYLQKKSSHNAQLVQSRKKELHNIYLITVKHIDCLNTADETNRKTFLVDLQRLYILPLPEYPTTTEQKIDALANYYRKISLSYRRFLKKIPESLHQTFKHIFCNVLQRFQEYRMTNIILLNKVEESGFFVLFRLQDITTNLMCDIVYELTHQRRFLWDKKCNNLNEYYTKYQNFFIKQCTMGIT